MPKFGTGSWLTRSALAFREPFETHGALRAEDGGSPWNTGRLPEPWSSQYANQAREGRVVYTVFSYNTPIAWVLDDKMNGEVVIPRETTGRNMGQPVKYSVTTTRHQGLLYALTADRETRGHLDQAAVEERQRQRDHRAEARAEQAEATTRREAYLAWQSLVRSNVQAWFDMEHPGGDPEGSEMRSLGFIQDADGIWGLPTPAPASTVPTDVPPARFEYSESYSERQGWASGNVNPHAHQPHHWWS